MIALSFCFKFYLCFNVFVSLSNVGRYEFQKLRSNFLLVTGGTLIFFDFPGFLIEGRCSKFGVERCRFMLSGMILVRVYPEGFQ